jgi:hypothetical protein
MKVEIFDAEKEIREAINSGASLEELAALVSKHQLQYLKEKQAKDADFEIIGQKQIPHNIS